MRSVVNRSFRASAVQLQSTNTAVSASAPPVMFRLSRYVFGAFGAAAMLPASDISAYVEIRMVRQSTVQLPCDELVTK
jgi:hypothetical protein